MSPDASQAGSELTPSSMESPEEPPEPELPPTVEDPDPTVDRRIDMAVAAAGSAIGVLLIVSSRDIRQGSVSDPIGSDGLAIVLGAWLIVGGLLLIGRRLLAWRRSGNQVPSDGAGDEFGLPASPLRSFVMWAAGFGWVFLLPRVGFMVSSLLLSVFGLVAMGVRSWVKLGVVPVVFTIVLWVLFNRVFGVQYPAGPVDLFFADLIPRMSL
ncbi:tripartite tricarboxylate transporter TctB family protein [Jiangella ureilytica]|uniref:Tripartite tricarboxylate transporter TctB family protein n=1 Tax=Jiangella ureilytica TaxID=2530374 RepID=A0A4V2XWW5_9ACTN|nr:tripartite tricarboxylate transporter TctB family protein [Jiangella ureilytica]TDC50915.1 tripartite tricarboxylate transporter TctB family protein [Jiangella ureilytica]